MIVQERENIFIRVTLDNTGKFSVPVYLNFIPDELRIVQLLHYGAGGDDVPYLLKWDGIGNLCYFDGGNTTTNINVRINAHGKAIAGSQTFTITSPDGTLSTALNGNELAVLMEGVKY